ncbi:unnamed protein product [Rotaria magnacalcarata]|uniref:Uncharacterized protein n=2 Tax=Rotaria magnacalcarata TaxID=392030 RepID=A0A815UY97_9BILA|nr:unnamed protein product [Rotaria magnacalcarata]
MNVYQKLYKTRRDKSTTDEYAFVTYLDENDVYSIVKFNRILDLNVNNIGMIKDMKGTYRIEVIEKGTLAEMEIAAQLVENDPKLTYEMHESVVSDCEEWHKRKSQKKSTTTNNETNNLSEQNKVDYSHISQHDPDFDSDSDDSTGEEDDDTTRNCTDNEDSTENDDDYVSNHLFKVSSATFQ